MQVPIWTACNIDRDKASCGEVICSLPDGIYNNSELHQLMCMNARISIIELECLYPMMSKYGIQEMYDNTEATKPT
jgi:hypothetical protein